MIDVSELEGLALDLAISGERVGREAAAAVRDTAQRVESTARSLAPVLTGRTRDSIGTDLIGDGRSEIEAQIGPTTWYARLVHDGTSRIGPNPFMQTALERHAPELVERLARVGVL